LRPITQLENVFKNIEDAVRLEHVKAAALAAAEVIREDAQRRWREIDPDDTASIIKRTDAGSIVNSVEVKIGPDKKEWQSLFAEIGTAHSSARPFLMPAFEEKGHEAAEVFAEELKQQIEEAARG